MVRAARRPAATRKTSRGDKRPRAVGGASSDLRTKILEAAVRMLEREGPNGLKQTRVAAEAGVEQGHLTYYFPTKADLVLGVFQHTTERYRAGAAAFVGSAGDEPPEKVFFKLATSMAKDRKRTRLMLSLILESGSDTALGKELEQVIAMQRAAMAFALGRAPSDVRVALALATLRGIGVEQLLYGDAGHSAEELVTELEKAFR